VVCFCLTNQIRYFKCNVYRHTHTLTHTKDKLTCTSQTCTQTYLDTDTDTQTLTDTHPPHTGIQPYTHTDKHTDTHTYTHAQTLRHTFWTGLSGHFEAYRRHVANVLFIDLVHLLRSSKPWFFWKHVWTRSKISKRERYIYTFFNPHLSDPPE